MPQCILGKSHNILALVCNNVTAIWDVSSKKLLKEIDTHTVTEREQIFYSELSHDDSHLILYSLDNKFIIWDIEKNCCVASMKNPHNESFLDLSIDKKYGIMRTPGENSIKLIDIPTNSIIKNMTCYGQTDTNKSFISSTGKFLSLIQDYVSEVNINFFHKQLFTRSKRLSKLYDTSLHFE
jgi:WD40 repeat protein